MSSIGEKNNKEFKKLLEKVNDSAKKDIGIMSVWLCLYIENYKKTNKLAMKFPEIKEIFGTNFNTENDFLNYVINLQIFGRKINTITFEIAIKHNEEYLAM